MQLISKTEIVLVEIEHVQVVFRAKCSVGLNEFPQLSICSYKESALVADEQVQTVAVVGKVGLRGGELAIRNQLQVSHIELIAVLHDDFVVVVFQFCCADKIFNALYWQVIEVAEKFVVDDKVFEANLLFGVEGLLVIGRFDLFETQFVKNGDRVLEPSDHRVEVVINCLIVVNAEHQSEVPKHNVLRKILLNEIILIQFIVDEFTLVIVFDVALQKANMDSDEKWRAQSCHYSSD